MVTQLEKNIIANCKRIEELQKKGELLTEEELNKLSWEKQFKRKRRSK